MGMITEGGFGFTVYRDSSVMMGLVICESCFFAMLRVIWIDGHREIMFLDGLHK